MKSLGDYSAVCLLYVTSTNCSLKQNRKAKRDILNEQKTFGKCTAESCLEHSHFCSCEHDLKISPSVICDENNLSPGLESELQNFRSGVYRGATARN